MDDVDRLIEDWIQVRTILKGHLRQLKDPGHPEFPGGENDRNAAETQVTIHRCVTEIEVLITRYSSRL